MYRVSETPLSAVSQGRRPARSRPRSLADAVQDRGYLLTIAARSAARDVSPAADLTPDNVVKYRARLAQMSNHPDLGVLVTGRRPDGT